MGQAANFEYRPEQQEMAVAVAQALSEERHLVVEAGTGVGKSLAYLIPAVLWAHEQKKKAVISTYTINLQEQLAYKDIPIVQKLLPFEFEAMLWKGRHNYLCPLRLERAMNHQADLFTSTEQAELSRIWEWAQTTQDGSLSNFNVEPDAAVWAQVCSEAHICTTKSCGTNPKCAYQRARKRLISREAGGLICATWRGTPGATYRVETSPTLQGWTPATTPTAAVGTGLFDFVEIPAANVTQRFYRAVRP